MRSLHSRRQVASSLPFSGLYVIRLEIRAYASKQQVCRQIAQTRDRHIAAETLEGGHADAEANQLNMADVQEARVTAEDLSCALRPTALDCAYLLSLSAVLWPSLKRNNGVTTFRYLGKP